MPKQTLLAAPTALGGRDLVSRPKESEDEAKRRRKENAAKQEAEIQKLVEKQVKEMTLEEQNEREKTQAKRKQEERLPVKGLNQRGTDLRDRDKNIGTNLQNRDPNRNLNRDVKLASPRTPVARDQDPRFNRDKSSNIGTGDRMRDVPQPKAQEFDHKLMASRQPQRDSMTQEQAAVQDAWAYQQIDKHGCCVAGFNWRPVRGGYTCQGGNHLITHQLLVDENGGYYERDAPNMPMDPTTPAGCWPQIHHNAMTWNGPKYLTPDDMRRVRELQRDMLPGFPPRPPGLVPFPYPGTGGLNPGERVSGRLPAVLNMGARGTMLGGRDVFNQTSPPLQKFDDALMAGKQKNRDKMVRAEAEQQDVWANQRIRRMTPCPNGLPWNRIKGGYTCTGTMHLVTDEQVVERRGGYYEVVLRGREGRETITMMGRKWTGPF